MSASAAAKRGRVEVDVDDAVRALRKIDHIVVLMMENRSFDHMLGYLRLVGQRPELDGLQADMANTYRDRSGKFPGYDGLSFGVHELLDTPMTKAQDPPHGGSSVDKQLKNCNGGFVQTCMDERGGPPEVHPADVMGYHTGKHLPVYDHLTEKFCVCDRWSAPCRARRSRTASTRWPAAPPGSGRTSIRRSTTCTHSCATSTTSGASPGRPSSTT